VRSRFNGAFSSVYLPRAPVVRTKRRSVRVRVVCGEGGARSCSGAIVVRQHGRVVGRAPFTVRPTNKRVRAMIVTVTLRGATRGAARLELLASSPWRSALAERRQIRLR
jgi:hypothetical protein